MDKAGFDTLATPFFLLVGWKEVNMQTVRSRRAFSIGQEQDAQYHPTNRSLIYRQDRKQRL